MSGFFIRAKKTVVAFVTAFVGAVLTAMQTGTVFRTEHGFGINMGAIATAAAVALGVAVSVFMARNNAAASRRTPPGDGSVM